jgi:hypothetical protein
MFLTLYSLHLLCSHTFISSASRRISCVCPAYVLCMYCVCPVYVWRAPDVQSVLHLRSNLTFGLILPRILEQVLCPRYSTFLSIFITFIPFHSISMFERFMICIVSFHMVCRLRYTPSGVHPACIPFYHLRSNLTFGRILPRIIEQVLCLRYSTFLSLFITFIPFHSISMFERFINCIVSFHMVCL